MHSCAEGLQACIGVCVGGGPSGMHRCVCVRGGGGAFRHACVVCVCVGLQACLGVRGGGGGKQLAATLQNDSFRMT